MPASQSRKEIIENYKKSRVKIENGITYEYALVEKIEFRSSYIMFKLKRKLDCARTDYLWFKPVSPEWKEEIRKYGHAILVGHRYFENKNFDPYFEHDFQECVNKEVIICHSKERFERMLDTIETEVRSDPALLALIETTNTLFSHIFK